MGGIERRRFLIAAGALLAGSAAAQGQRAPKIHRIGVLVGFGSKDGWLQEPVVVELRKLGYEEGRTCTYEVRSANGVRGVLPALAPELVAAGVEVIIAALPPAILAAKSATSTIPIVMRYGMVPRELGLIESLARPGGNVTGTLLNSPDSAGKYCQLMRDVLPRQARLALPWDTGFPGLEPYMVQIDRATRELGLRPELWPIRSDEDLEAAFARLASERYDALSFSPTGPIGRQVKRLLKFALDHRIAAFSTTKWPVEEGALLSYEPDLEALDVRTAAIVDKVLRGGKPAEIPVEEPAKFELWINLKTAKALGLTIPKLVQLQATRVIE